jgi:hypothetical protein
VIPMFRLTVNKVLKPVNKALKPESPIGLRWGDDIDFAKRSQRRHTALGSRDQG